MTRPWCGIGAVLLLGGLLTTERAGAEPSRAALALSVAVGPQFAHAKARYDPWDVSEGAPGPSFDSHVAVTPGAAFTFTAGGRIGSRLLVGGAIGFSVGRLPDRFTGEREGHGAFAVGPELALLPTPQGGAFAFARGGIGTLHALAWSAAAGGGYAFPLEKSTLLGLGLELSGAYSRFGEDGDFGTYSYKDEVLVPAVVARLMF